MLTQKEQELAHVAMIGLDRLGRHSSFGAEPSEPLPDRGDDVGSGERPDRVMVEGAGASAQSGCRFPGRWRAPARHLLALRGECRWRMIPKSCRLFGRGHVQNPRRRSGKRFKLNASRSGVDLSAVIPALRSRSVNVVENKRTIPMPFRNAKLLISAECHSGYFLGCPDPRIRRPLMPTRVVDVLVPVALDCAYSYRAPSGLALAPGDIVCVPLGTRERTAVVWAENAAPDPRLDNRLKSVTERLDLPPLRPELRDFVDWLSAYTLTPRGMVLRMALRLGERLGPERVRTGVRLAGTPPQRMTAARTRVLGLLADGLARAKAEAAEQAGVSVGVLDGLIDEGTLDVVELPVEPPVAAPPDPGFNVPSFTPAQEEAGMALRETARQDAFSATLLDGVTGSGKTEVYFEAVAEAIRRGRQALILMPEIALTTQFLDRFARRFGVRPAEWHSQINSRRRARIWRAVASGEVTVVAGARSALFLPFANLGLIVVDEEHDAGYKQEDGARYHARDMAVVRAHLADIPIVLASATPSVETEVNVRRGRYRRLRLPERFGGARLPAVTTIDLTRGRAAAWPICGAAPGEGDGGRARTRRTGAAVPQSARLCALDALPRLRFSASHVRIERRVARRPSLSPATRLHHCGFANPQPPPEPCPPL